MKKSRTQRALEAQIASNTEAIKGRNPLVEYYNKQTTELMQPETFPIIEQGEVVPVDDSTIALSLIKNTLEDPDSPAVDASIERTSLLLDAGALEIGIDAAHSIKATNSIEKMLAHQMALLHTNSMKMMTEAMGSHPMDSNSQTFMIKKMNLAARLMEVYQKGMDTMTRTRTAGKQTIVVKQIHVNGGQNVISDTVTTGGRGGGGQSENE